MNLHGESPNYGTTSVGEPTATGTASERTLGGSGEPIPSIIGAGVPRIEGRAKTTGMAFFSADYHFPGMVHLVPVCSTISKGRVTRVDDLQARQMPGVLRVMYHGNAPAMYRPPADDADALVEENRPPFDDNIVYYGGQYVAAVVAETIEQAQAAAETIRVEYVIELPDVGEDLSDGWDALATQYLRGNSGQSFASAPITIDATYVTPAETHNPIELHASVALWDGSKFTLYETTQAVVNHRVVMARFLGVPIENIQIVTKFLGSGFGGKLRPWTHAPLAAATARELNRPVKVVVSRRMMFTNVGHRPRTEQRIRLGAAANGKLVSIHHEYVNQTSPITDYDEGCDEATPYLYSCPNVMTRSSMVRRNIGPPTPMRGPGIVPGMFALESAMDELAFKLKLDPVQLRLRNEPSVDESNGKPFSSRHMTECLRLGAQQFGWLNYNPVVGSMRNNDLTLGWGMACTSWEARRSACEVKVAFIHDGTVSVSCATQDIGTGTYTIFAQAISAKTGLPLERISVLLGDSTLAPGPTSGNSKVTASVLPAIASAVHAAFEALVKVAVTSSASPFVDKQSKSIRLVEGRLHASDEGSGTGVAFEDILRAAKMYSVEGVGKSDSINQDPVARKYSQHSFGAHFVEISWDAGICHLHVNRVVSVIDVGRVINEKTARNQVEGAIVMGIGMALFEETRYDPRSGIPVNCNLADYMVPTCADSPRIEVNFLDYPDLTLNEFGARGVGEIGVAGVAAAITAAVHHATGTRIRELPVRIEALMAQSI